MAISKQENGWNDIASKTSDFWKSFTEKFDHTLETIPTSERLSRRRVGPVDRAMFKAVATVGRNRSASNASSAKPVARGPTGSGRKSVNAMWGESLNNNIKDALADRLEAWELVDFLDITIEDVLAAFEDKIVENLDEVLDFAGIQGLETENEND